MAVGGAAASTIDSGGRELGPSSGGAAAALADDGAAASTVENGGATGVQAARRVTGGLRHRGLRGRALEALAGEGCVGRIIQSTERAYLGNFGAWVDFRVSSGVPVFLRRGIDGMTKVWHLFERVAYAFATKKTAVGNHRKPSVGYQVFPSHFARFRARHHSLRHRERLQRWGALACRRG